MNSLNFALLVLLSVEIVQECRADDQLQKQWDEYKQGSYDDTRVQTLTEESLVLGKLFNDIDALVEKLSESNKDVLLSGLKTILGVANNMAEPFGKLETTTELGTLLKTFYVNLNNVFSEYFTAILNSVEEKPSEGEAITKEDIFDLYKSAALEYLGVMDNLMAGDKGVATKNQEEVMEASKIFENELDNLGSKLQSPESKMILDSLKALMDVGIEYTLDKLGEL